MAREHIVIVGSGMAGGKLLEELERMQPGEFDLTVIGDEPYGNYDRIKLVNKLKDDGIEDFWLNSEEWYAEHGITTVLGERVEQIDSKKKLVKTDKRTEISYDKLVLALGSLPLIPPIKGTDNDRVFTLRTLDDANRLRHKLKGKERVLLIGGGLLGLELAYALKEMGKRVVVTDLMEALLSNELDQEASEILRQKLRNKGMYFILGNYITQVTDSEDGQLRALFVNGREEFCDVVVICTGVIPNKALGEKSALFTNRGILVDEHLGTSVADIFAIGECIEYKGKTWGLVAPVYEQTRALAQYLCGDENASYQDQMLAPTRLKCDIPVISMGRTTATPNQTETVFKDPKGLIYKKLISLGDQLLGAIIIGEELNVDAISLHYTAKLPLPDNVAELLFPEQGEGSARIPDASAWPDDINICDCNGISAGRIREVIDGGADTLFAAMQKSRAGIGCGVCKNRIKGLLIDSVGELRKDPREEYFLPGIPMKRTELEETIRNNQLQSVSEVLDSIPEALGDAKTRMGLDFLLSFIWKGAYILEKDSQFVNDRYHANIQKDGKFSVIPRLHGGIITPRELRSLADVAEKYKVKLIKITGADRIGLFSVRREQLADVWKDLNMDSGHAYGKYHRAAKACVGSNFCRAGLKDSLKMGKMMDDRYRGMFVPAKTKMASSGCPRNCSEATIKDFGVVASPNGWDIFIGGNGGTKVAVAKKLTQVKTDAEVFKIADRFFEYYRRHGSYHERTASFIERIGFETVRDAILFDTEQNIKQLEDDFEEYHSRYKDPWKQEESWQKQADIVAVED